MGSSEYRIEVLEGSCAAAAPEWNALLDRQPSPTPFMRHEYLDALHASGSAVKDTGWAPVTFLVRRGDRLAAACATFLKAHSYGEYVFDWAWADAYRRHGLHYYPKLLGAVPFTPVPGTRLLAEDEPARVALASALRRWASSARLSSAHVLFVDEADREALRRDGWMLREGVQFHWQQDAIRPVLDLEDLLTRMRHDKRKKVHQDRRHVADAGVQFEVREGADIRGSDWDFFHHCYTRTYAAHHSTPYLTRDFFARMAESMPEHWVMFVARQDGVRVASSLVAVDRARGAAWGRYWGCTQHVPSLHFEACYYQPLQWCIAQGMQRFEGGAQGEHKMSRGLLPVPTWSAHWLRDGRFADAVGDFLAREGRGVEHYLDDLSERSPFKAPGQP